MQVKRVTLKNFRNYGELSVDFAPGFNLISGKNGQGKTNLVEAVMLCALTKSPRTSRDDDMRRDGTEDAEVELLIERKFGELRLSCTLSEALKKNFFINGNKVSKVSDVFGNLVAVYFSPADLKVVSGGPADRRDFIDTDISQLSGYYYSILQRYNKVLEQRNKLLKTSPSRAAIEDQIEVWDRQLAVLAGHIVKTRKSFIKKLTPHAKAIMSEITRGEDELDIYYSGPKGETSDEIRDEILHALKFNLSKDIELGYTTVGPHRDDLKFELNSKDTKIYASQGQQRSIALALKIAELEVFEKELGEKPVLVLDDVFSELDSSRQRLLYKKLGGTQVMMTGTLFKFKPDEPYLGLVVREGKISSKPRLHGGGTAK